MVGAIWEKCLHCGANLKATFWRMTKHASKCGKLRKMVSPPLPPPSSSQPSVEGYLPPPPPPGELEFANSWCGQDPGHRLAVWLVHTVPFKGQPLFQRDDIWLVITICEIIALFLITLHFHSFICVLHFPSHHSLTFKFHFSNTFFYRVNIATSFNYVVLVE